MVTHKAHWSEGVVGYLYR